MRKILVTGGSGFVGSHLLELLGADPNLELHATAFGQLDQDLSEILTNVTFHRLDLTDFPSTAKLIEAVTPDQIYHLASFAATGKSFAQAQAVLSNNSTLQLNLLEAIRQYAPHARTLIVSSAEVYGEVAAADLPIQETQPLRPANPYAVSKLTQEMLAYAYQKSYGLTLIRVRPFNHIGERQTDAFVIASFAKQIARVEAGLLDQVSVGNLNAIRDFTDVKDVVKAYQLLMQKADVSEVYNLGSGQGVKIKDMLDALLKLSSAQIKVITDPAKTRPQDSTAMVADCAKLNQLGWQTQISLEQTLKRVLDYWRGQV